jgi:transcriptional regulator NrdR family protein
MKRLDSPYCACPKGKGSKVLESRMDTRYGFAWRRRACLGCGADFATYELPVDALDIDAYTPINSRGKIDR